MDLGIGFQVFVCRGVHIYLRKTMADRDGDDIPNRGLKALLAMRKLTWRVINNNVKMLQLVD
jgi:hypothetical protein